MISGVVFWPQPPLLLPEYASAADLGAAVRRAAFEALAAVRPESGPVLLLTGAERCAPLGERVARALLQQAGVGEPDAVIRVAVDADAAAVAEAADRVRAAAAAADGPVTLLVAGDGTARASVGAPERADLETRAADERIAAALAAADPAPLAALTASEGAELLISGRLPWQVAAAALTGRRPRSAYAWFDCPYEVGYHVAAWRMTE
ncbi:hypothetical protein CGZ94_06235 [Enemella evansiae]|uniref:Uncharacterized protein n=1 Tax=Enemella evansiae TaxID=2016499 RepID=A0A255GN62_9ACTN|nr:hypothetical protein [Enemella evansiae]OYO15833.1 hypothetical protein CGZ94_06235 [Enemella evansiae]